MADAPPSSFVQEASRFRAWTRATRQGHAEWGSCYPHWGRICVALERTLAGGRLDPEQADAVLDLMVHDQRGERIVDLLGPHPMLAYQVAARGARDPRTEVRWCVVPLLGRLGSFGAVELLHGLCHDPEPAVRRHARSALAALDPALAAPDPAGHGEPARDREPPPG